MSKARWRTVDAYLDSLHPADEVLGTAHARTLAENLPDIAVSAGQGRLLTILALSVGARSILEIGTLAGYSSICLARALPADGRLITLEVDPTHAGVARENIAAAGFSERVTVVVGPALDTLPEVEVTNSGGFDFIFIDADKEAYPDYWPWALRLAHPGTLIVADNVVRDGAVADAGDRDPRVEGARRYLKLAAAEPTVMETTIQTVGTKGYDGLSISIVAPAVP